MRRRRTSNGRTLLTAIEPNRMQFLSTQRMRRRRRAWARNATYRRPRAVARKSIIQLASPSAVLLAAVRVSRQMRELRAGLSQDRRIIFHQLYFAPSSWSSYFCAAVSHDKSRAMPRSWMPRNDSG